jgi:hypothetical protein
VLDRRPRRGGDGSVEQSLYWHGALAGRRRGFWGVASLRVTRRRARGWKERAAGAQVV